MTSASQINAARNAAATLAASIKGAHTGHTIERWRDIETKFGVELSALTGGNPWTEKGKEQVIERWLLNSYLDSFIKDTPARLQRSAAAVTANHKLRLTPESECFHFPDSDVTLFTEQDPAAKEVIHRMFDDDGPNISHILVPGGVGSGKTMIGAYFMYQAIKKYGYDKPPDVWPIPINRPLQWVTVPNAVPQTREEIERVGLGEYLDSKLFVYGYNTLSCGEGLGIYTAIEEEQTATFEDENDMSTVKRRIVWQSSAIMRALVVDEMHALMNEDAGRTRIFRDLKNKLEKFKFFNTKVLWLSGTPFEKLNDARTFVTFAGINFGGIRINDENFTTSFANPLSNGKPDEPTAASMERLFGAIKSHVVEIPYYPWPRKAINFTEIYPVPEGKRAYINGAWGRHLERCKAVGKDTPRGRGQILASMTIYRHDTEHVRVPQMINEMIENVRKGNTSVMGTAFTGSIILGVNLLLNAGYSRDDFSIVWGGRENIKPDKVLSQQEMFAIVQEIVESGDVMSTELRRLIKRNLAWQEDKMLFDDVSDEAQAQRYAWLASLGLVGIQTKAKRLEEINRFKTGRSRFCLFTLQSGGTGLSLPHADNRTAPRQGWFTPIFNGKEFTQAFGRCPRRVSISDTYQRCCLLDRTIESEIVAPILDIKLRSGGAFTSKKTDLMAAISDLFMRDKNSFYDGHEFASANIRSLDQATHDALNDESTQSHKTDTNDEDDGDDVLTGNIE